MKLVTTPQEAAKMLSTRPTTVYEMLEAGELPGYREGSYWKIPVKLLEQYVYDRAAHESAERRKLNEEVQS